MKKLLILLFSLLISFNAYAGHSGREEGGEENLKNLSFQQMDRMMSANILAGGNLHEFLEGKYLSGYWHNLKEFEEKYYSLEDPEGPYDETNKGKYWTKFDGQEYNGYWWIEHLKNGSAWFQNICFEIEGKKEGCSFLIADKAGVYDKDEPIYYFGTPDTDRRFSRIIAKVLKIKQFEEGKVTEIRRLAYEKQIKEEKEEKLKQQQQYEKKIQNEIKTGVKLVEGYVNYLIIKNLNDQYGSNNDLNESKKLIKLIEDHYKDLVETDIDLLWQKAKTEYTRGYASNVETLSSFYSSQGLNLFNLIRMSLQTQANEIGISSSNTDKDF